MSTPQDPSKGSRRGESNISARNPLIQPPASARKDRVQPAEQDPRAGQPPKGKQESADPKSGMSEKVKDARGLAKAAKGDLSALSEGAAKRAVSKTPTVASMNRLVDKLPDEVDADGNVTPGKAKETIRDLGNDTAKVATAAATGFARGNVVGAVLNGARAAVTSKTGKKGMKLAAGAALAITVGAGMVAQQAVVMTTGMVGATSASNDAYTASTAISSIEDKDTFSQIRRYASSTGAPWEILAATWQVSTSSGLNTGTGPYGIDLDQVDGEISQEDAMDLEKSTAFVGEKFSEAMRGTVSTLQSTAIDSGSVELEPEGDVRKRAMGEDEASVKLADETREQYVAALEQLPLANIENQATAIFSMALGWRIGTASQCESPLASGDSDSVLVGETTAKMDESQVKYAQIIINRVAERGMPSKAAVVALATVQQESKFRMYWSIRVPGSKELAPDPQWRGSDHYSVGLFQQQVNGNKFAWGTVEDAMDPVKSTDMFLNALEKVNGWEDLSVAQAAQRVQISAFPDAYAQWEDLARQLVKDLPPTNDKGYKNDHSHEEVIPAGNKESEEESTEESDKDASTEGTATPSGDVPMSEGKNPYNLKVDSSLKSDTQAVQAEIVKHWGEYVYSMGGYRAGSVGHSQRIATDLMVVDYKSDNGIAAGNAMTEYLIQNKDQLGVNYIIWRNQIWLGAKSGWKPYKDGGFGKHLAARGWNDTTLHYDHLHVEVFGNRGTGGATAWDPNVKTIEGDGAVFTESDGNGGGSSGGSDDCAGGGMNGTSPISNTDGQLGWDDDYPYRDPQGDCSWCAGSADPGADPWGLYKRECVSFVAWRVNQLMGWQEGQPYPFTMAKMGMAGQGSAKHWGHSLKKKGYKVDMTPAIGAVAWWDAWEKNQYYSVYGMGHVAIVKSIDGDMVTMEQYNGSTVLGKSERSRYSTMTLHKDAVSGYIHIADVQPGSDQVQAGGEDKSDEGSEKKDEPAQAATLGLPARKQG